MKRVFVIVLDSCGIGFEPDAADFGDVGANTLHTCSLSPEFHMDNLISMGLGSLDGVDYLPKTDKPAAALARLQELSRGKDTTIGHWEIAGIVSPQPLPTFPDGFPEEILKPFREQTGRGVLCNKPYSGTEVIKDYGREHVATGDLIVYTSADSVFQIAAARNWTRPASRTRSARTRHMNRSFRRSSFMNTAASRGSCCAANMASAASLPAHSRVNGRSAARRGGMISRWSRRRRRCWTPSRTRDRT